jgi:hypothetical protein
MAGNNSERVFSKRSTRVNTAFGCGENIPFVRGAFTHHAPDERNLFFQRQRANVQSAQQQSVIVVKIGT